MVDVHLKTIGGLRRNRDRSYIYKFGVLTSNEHKIKENDETCQRMVDLIQSYYIYASHEFEMLNSVLKRLDRETLELCFDEKESKIYC